MDDKPTTAIPSVRVVMVYAASTLGTLALAGWGAMMFPLHSGEMTTAEQAKDLQAFTQEPFITTIGQFLEMPLFGWAAIWIVAFAAVYLYGFHMGRSQVGDGQ